MALHDDSIISYTESTNMIISEEEFATCDTVSDAFLKLQAKLTKILTAAADFPSIRRACITQKSTPGGAHLPEQLIEKILSTRNINMLLDVLVCSPYWSWIDIRILQAIVVTSEIPQALQNLKNYKTAIFSRRLIELLPNLPSKEIKETFYKKIVSKLKKDANKMTVADLLDFQTELETVIMDIGQGTCVFKELVC